MPSPFTIDDTGLSTPSSVEARARVVELWKQRYGADAQTGSDSPDGLQIDILSILLLLVWQGLGKVYANRFVRTATGVQLDLILEAFGRSRLPAQASVAPSFVIYGDAATVIPAGTQYRVESTDEIFESDGVVTLLVPSASDAVVWLVQGATGLAGQTFSVGIDVGAGVIVTSFVTTGGDTNLSVAGELRDAINANAGLNSDVLAHVAGTDGDGFARLVIETLTGPVTAATEPTPTRAALQAAAIQSPMTAVNTGPTTAATGELDIIGTTVTGMDGGANFEPATVGRNLETDDEYRRRHFAALNAGGCGSPQAIAAGLLENAKVGGIQIIEAASVIENTGDVVDPVTGLPPHSFQAVVLTQQQALGNPPTADELDAVAAEIFRCKPAGIQTFGSTTRTVVDANGDSHDINFELATVLWLWLDITISKGEFFPAVGDFEATIAEEVASFFGRGGDGELRMGDDFERFRASEPILRAVPQVNGATILTGTTAVGAGEPVGSASDVIVPSDTILAVDVSRIVVTVPP